MDISWKPILCHPIHTVPLGQCQYWYYVGGVNVTEVPMRGLRRVVGGGRWCSVQNVWHKRSCLPLSIVALGTWMRSSPGWSLTWRGNFLKKNFYRVFSNVKYSYLPKDTFRKYVERHVTCRKLAFNFTGYCRQSRYTDSAVVFTLLPAL